MIVPYFLSSVTLLLTVGIALCAIPWMFRS
jgi:hypothetical protein